MSKMTYAIFEEEIYTPWTHKEEMEINHMKKILNYLPSEIDKNDIQFLVFLKESLDNEDYQIYEYFFKSERLETQYQIFIGKSEEEVNLFRLFFDDYVGKIYDIIYINFLINNDIML